MNCRAAAPGLLVVAALVAGAAGLAAAVPSVNLAIWAFALGVLAGSVVRRRAGTLDPGIQFAARSLLRAGVALLGLGIAVSDLKGIGVAGFVIAGGVISTAILAAIAIGRALGVAPGLAVLIGAGSGICGASAVVAMKAVTGTREEETGYALVTVTLFGSVAMILAPLLATHVFGLGPRASGLWLGASIHEVAQVAGAGASISATVLQEAILMKLARVVLLAPTIACAAVLRGSGGRGGAGVPGFVIVFLALIAVRATLDIPPAIVDLGAVASTGLLAAGLGALGAQVDFKRLLAAGPLPLLLGCLSWLITASVALVLVLLIG